MRRWTLRLWAELSCWLCWVSWKENWKPRMLSYMPSEWVRNDGMSHSKPWPTKSKLTCFGITPSKRMQTNREVMYKQETEPVKTMAQEIFGFLCISFHQSASCAAVQLPWLRSSILKCLPFYYSDLATPKPTASQIFSYVFTGCRSPIEIWAKKELKHV